MTKVCTKCKEEKPKSEFYKDKQNTSGLKSWCKTCSHSYTKELNKKNPDVKREWYLKTKYGLTLEQWVLLFEQQGGRCAICFTFEPNGRYDTFHVDHDHNTGVIRGLLCDSCNRGIGLLKDSTTVLKSAVSYLERFKCE
jgi:hypothetical protein